MSKLDINLRARNVGIRVADIRSYNKKGAAGLPEIEIQDNEGRVHTISAIDLSAPEFEKIKPGTTIQVQVQESWTNLKVLN
jgi:hypothetical protein